MVYKRTGLTLKEEEYNALVGKLRDMGYSCLSEFVRVGILQGKVPNLVSKVQANDDSKPVASKTSNPIDRMTTAISFCIKELKAEFKDFFAESTIPRESIRRFVRIHLILIIIKGFALEPSKYCSMEDFLQYFYYCERALLGRIDR